MAALPTFVAIDFETANECHDSACAIGVALIEGESIVHSFQRLIRPPTSHFSEWNFRIHGIHWDDVAQAGDFPVVWAEVQEAIRHAGYFVAHNAGFDQQVLAACCDFYDLAPPDTEFICTVEAASALWPLDSYKLPRVCEFLGIPLSHHNAKSDAEASATILLKALAHGFDPIADSRTGAVVWAAKNLSAEVVELVSSIMDDGKVEPAEIQAAAEWMAAHEDATKVWPGTEMHRRLQSILEDGRIEDVELDDFRDLCAAILGLRERKKTKRASRKKPGTVSVCFSGFGPRKAELRSEAEAAGYHVAGSVTKSLDYLVCGPEPGPAKMETAMERGIKIISADEWRAIVQNSKTVR